MKQILSFMTVQKKYVEMFFMIPKKTANIMHSIPKSGLKKNNKSTKIETADLNRKPDSLNLYLDCSPKQQTTGKNLDNNTQSL